WPVETLHPLSICLITPAAGFSKPNRRATHQLAIHSVLERESECWSRLHVHASYCVPSREAEWRSRRTLRRREDARTVPEAVREDRAAWQALSKHSATPGAA